LTGGVVGTAYNQTLTATGHPAATWSITSGSLPAGLNLSSGGTISGTPSVSGIFNFTVNAVNAAGSDNKALSITINEVPSISTASLAGGVVGVGYNQTLTATGYPAATWSIASGSLPSGLTLSSAGVISGTPSASGTFNFTVEATNSAGSDTKALSMIINPAPVSPTITTMSPPGGSLGVAYNQTLTATGDPTITWSVSAGSLPGGLSLSSAGVISGTPSVSGIFNFTVNAVNAAGNDSKALSITIDEVPSISTASLTGGVVGTTYSQQLAAAGYPAVTWSIASGSLPGGLNLSSDGAISGTPTASGTFNFTVSAVNSAGSDSKALSITVDEVPSITTASLTGGVVGTAYNQVLTATGHPAATWSIASGSLPGGLSLSSDGTISGTPSTAGTFNFTVSAANSVGSDTKALSIVISPAPVPPTITTTTLPGSSLGVAYSQTLMATGDPTIAWSITAGSLPGGLSLSSNGTISGTPTTDGMFTFTVRATNDAGNDTKVLSIFISTVPLPPAIVTPSLPNSTIGTVYFQALTASGDAATWNVVVGSLPGGLTLSSAGVMSGTSSASGTFSFTVEATNAAGSDTKAFSIIVVQQPSISTASLTGGVVGTAYSQQLSATGYPTITWSIASGSLPGGLSLSSDGTISGTPSAAGTFNFTVTAGNSAGNETVGLSITIAPVTTPGGGSSPTTLLIVLAAVAAVALVSVYMFVIRPRQ